MPIEPLNGVDPTRRVPVNVILGNINELTMYERAGRIFAIVKFIYYLILFKYKPTVCAISFVSFLYDVQVLTYTHWCGRQYHSNILTPSSITLIHSCNSFLTSLIVFITILLRLPSLRYRQRYIVRNNKELYSVSMPLFRNYANMSILSSLIAARPKSVALPPMNSNSRITAMNCSNPSFIAYSTALA